MTKYYYAGTQRIAMRKNGTLSYILGDHLGSTSLVTDSSGAVINQTKYKAWGETRYSSGSEQTKYGYTGQYSYASDFGLHFYNARWYDSSLGRFAQADTIVPGGSQGLDRYAYVGNNPINYIDPSGHARCDEDGNCNDGSSIHVEDYYHGNNSNNPLMGCGIHCSRDEINDSSLEERAGWFIWLRGQMDSHYGEGTGDWFLNVSTIVAGFIVTGQDDNQWLLNVDANILGSIQDGFAASIGTPNGVIKQDSSVSKWLLFFENVNNNDLSPNDKIKLWGDAEQAATDEGGKPSFAIEHWDDHALLLVGNIYRTSGNTVCFQFNCSGSFFDPRVSAQDMLGFMGVNDQFSPVGYVESFIYSFDYMNR